MGGRRRLDELELHGEPAQQQSTRDVGRSVCVFVPLFVAFRGRPAAPMMSPQLAGHGLLS